MLVKVLTRRDEGIVQPWWYGRAWFRFERDETVLMVIPLNWFAGVLREWSFTFRRGPRSKLEAAQRTRISEAYTEGFQNGLKSITRAMERLEKQYLG